MYDIFDKLMKEKGVTMYRVSKDTKIAQATLIDWKNGKTHPKYDKMQKIAEYFNVPVDYLLTGEEKENPPAASSEGKYPEKYNLLNETNKAIVDRLIADLAKSQSNQ
ncbi:Helix-turn-helix domain protein [anaerobic digester metagenome]